MPFSPSDPASSETRTPPSTPIHRCTSLIGSQPLCLATTSGIRTILSANKTNSTWVTESCFILCTHQVPRLDHKITIGGCTWIVGRPWRGEKPSASAGASDRSNSTCFRMDESISDWEVSALAPTPRPNEDPSRPALRLSSQPVI